MKFGEYLKILKCHFKEGISNEDLCMLLFDSIIEPLDLRGQNGEILSYSKSRISEFINSKASIPKSIRDGYNDERVTQSIVDYFQANIVIRLSPDYDDLFYQMMKLIDNDDSISPMSKSNLRLLASTSTVSIFLVQSFGYSLRKKEFQLPAKETHSVISSREISTPILSIAGIIDGDVSFNSFSIGMCELVSQEDKLSLKEKAQVLFRKAAAISLPEYKKPHSLLAIQNYNQPIELDEDERRSIECVAESLEIELPNGFFNLGNLEYDRMGSVLLNNGLALKGSDFEKRKYRLIEDLKDVVYKIISFINIDKSFTRYKSMSLALCNTGTCADQNISVSVSFPSDAYVSVDDLLKFDNQILEALLFEYSDERFFYIKRTASVLDYDESIDKSIASEGFRLISPIRNRQHSKADFREAFEDVFPYFISEKDGNITITADFDEVLHNTNVAFPSLILLNGDISSIDYSIRSRNIPAVVEGTLNCF